MEKFIFKYTPKRGGCPSDFSGSSSDITSWKTVSPRSNDTPSEIFSPHSGGSQKAVNPSMVKTVDGKADVVRWYEGSLFKKTWIKKTTNYVLIKAGFFLKC